LFKLGLPFAFAVPADTSIQEIGFDALPATGPYAITEASEDRVELERNPRFREWSAAAQPDGFAEAISIVFGEDDDAFDRLVSDELDVMLVPPSPGDLAVARAEYPDRVFEATTARTLFIGFDVVKPPFDDEGVRQAVSYAIDRGRLVDLLGGTASQRATCQILPPNFQGYTPYCPFTRDAGTEWSGPDMDRARKLVTQADADGEPVRVWAAEGQSGSVDMMKQVTAVLNEIGLRAELEVLPSDAFVGGVFAPAGSPKHPQVFSYDWVTGYPGAFGSSYTRSTDAARTGT
jgi:peptide/nickel transport system substrate-binding protein